MKIGVIGAGVMGKGVSQRFAQYGYEVVLHDADADVINTAKDEIERNLRMLAFFNKKINTADVLANIKTTTEYADMADVDFVIENVTEDVQMKESVYRALEDHCKETCIYLANTSCIPITLIGSYTNRPDKVIGVHFMNPVPVKNFAEVIRGVHTSENTIQIIHNLLKEVEIEIEIVNDSAGFVSNRLSHLFMNEAAALVYENVATAEQIDNIFKKAFGHKMGPLETADLIGLDTVLDSLKVLYDQYEDTKYKACPLLKKMVYAGYKGRKTGKGFYEY